jgi:hypothetical protein
MWTHVLGLKAGALPSGMPGDTHTTRSHYYLLTTIYPLFTAQKKYLAKISFDF